MSDLSPLVSSAAVFRGLSMDSMLSLSLDSRPMTVIEVDGRPFFLATEIGTALGYAPTAFKNLLNRDWADRLRPDKDLIKLEGEDLRALKDLGVVAKNTAAVLLLSESGLYRVLMASHKPIAFRLQEWLADDVLPAIRKTGAYAPKPTLEDQVALKLGRAAFKYVRQTGIYDMPRLAILTRACVPLLNGETDAVVIAKKAGMHKGNAYCALMEAQRQGIAIPTGDDRKPSKATWLLVDTLTEDEVKRLTMKEPF